MALLVADLKINSKYSLIPLSNGMTGKDVAEKMLADHGIKDVVVSVLED